MDARSAHDFSEFVAARSVFLLRIARVLTGSRHQAEDLVQEALTKLASRWDKVADPDAYVRRVIYHHQVSLWRRRAKVREETTETVPDLPTADRSSHVEDQMDVRQALMLLGRRQRAVLVLRYFEDLPEREVAEILGCSIGTVRSQAHRALARLRTLAPDLAGGRPQPMKQP